LIDPGQWRVAIRLVDIKARLPRRFFPQHAQALPEKMLVFGLAAYLG
jgi:hypothetical protein